MVGNEPNMTLKMVLGCCPPRRPSNRTKYPPQKKLRNFLTAYARRSSYGLKFVELLILVHI